MRFNVFFLTGILLLVVSGCSENKTDYSRSEKLFVEHCGSCHGPDGKGKFFRGIPATILTEKPVEQIVTQIRVGSEPHKKIKMRPLTELSNQDAKLIAEFVLMKKEEFERTSDGSERLLKPGTASE